VRRAAPAATLIEEDETVSVGIEIASPAGDRARARAAVNHERWFPFWIAALLPIDLMPVAYIHEALLVVEVRFASDSLLEGTGFEPSVPLLQKALLGVANRDVGTISGTT